MKAQLVIDGAEYDLDRKSLEAISKALPDIRKNEDIFSDLAHSPSARIRKNIAEKEYLNDETIESLLMDDSPIVLNGLLNNEAFMSSMRPDQLEYLTNIRNTKTLLKLLDNDTFITYTASRLIYSINLKNPMILSRYRDLIDKDIFISGMDISSLDYLISTGDTILLSNIACYLDEYVHEFNVCDMDWLCENLINSNNTEVKVQLARNSWTPEPFLRQLKKDSDNSVSNQAKKTLKEIKEDREEFDIEE